MRQKLALTALAALAAASSPGGPDDAEAALRNLLTSLRPVYSKWKEAETPEQQPAAPPAVVEFTCTVCTSDRLYMSLLVAS